VDCVGAPHETASAGPVTPLTVHTLTHTHWFAGSVCRVPTVPIGRHISNRRRTLRAHLQWVILQLSSASHHWSNSWHLRRHRCCSGSNVQAGGHDAVPTTTPPPRLHPSNTCTITCLDCHQPTTLLRGICHTGQPSRGGKGPTGRFVGLQACLPVQVCPVRCMAFYACGRMVYTHCDYSCVLWPCHPGTSL
jgi:hypothetical protein